MTSARLHEHVNTGVNMVVNMGVNMDANMGENMGEKQQQSPDHKSATNCCTYHNLQKNMRNTA